MQSKEEPGIAGSQSALAVKGEVVLNSSHKVYRQYSRTLNMDSMVENHKGKVLPHKPYMSGKPDPIKVSRTRSMRQSIANLFNKVRKTKSPERDEHEKLSKSVTSQEQKFSDLKTGILEIHNVLRVFHGSPLLTLDDELCEEAQAWAEKIATDGIMQYQNGDSGENMFTILKLKYKSEAAEACECWYQEVKKYKYEEPKILNSNVAHFTQMIWADTKTMGIGRAVRDKKVFIVVHYKPRGNLIGQFVENVGRPKSRKTPRFS